MRAPLHHCTRIRDGVELEHSSGGNVRMSACFPCGWHPESRGLSTHMRTSAKYKNTTSERSDQEKMSGRPAPHLHCPTKFYFRMSGGRGVVLSRGCGCARHLGAPSRCSHEGDHDGLGSFDPKMYVPTLWDAFDGTTRRSLRHAVCCG